MYLVLEGGQKYTKNVLAMGVTIGGDAAKIGNNINLLVIMRAGLSQKTSLLNLKNQT